MSLIEILAIAVGLSVDAFTASVSKGLSMCGRRNFRTAFAYGIAFGFFQTLMPIIGYFIGEELAGLLAGFAKYLVFLCFIVLGAKTFIDAFRKDDEGRMHDDAVHFLELASLAVATSIDALAVGFSFALLEASILTSALVIGLVTFSLCFAGVLLGCMLGSRVKKIASCIGGGLLILLAVKVILGD